MPRSSCRDVRAGVDPRLLAFADRNGLHITSGKGGVHNKGSKHYVGQAIDFRTRGMKEAFFQHLVRDAAAHGLLVRDERQRPPGQKVWGAPHGHLEVLPNGMPRKDNDQREAGAAD